jgi:hypothetical protein
VNELGCGVERDGGEPIVIGFDDQERSARKMAYKKYGIYRARLGEDGVRAGS